MLHFLFLEKKLSTSPNNAMFTLNWYWLNGLGTGGWKCEKFTTTADLDNEPMLIREVHLILQLSWVKICSVQVMPGLLFIKKKISRILIKVAIRFLTFFFAYVVICKQLSNHSYPFIRRIVNKRKCCAI